MSFAVVVFPFVPAIKIILTFVLVYVFAYGILGATYAYLLSFILASIISFYIINKHIFNFITFKKIKKSYKLRKEILMEEIKIL